MTMHERLIKAGIKTIYPKDYIKDMPYNKQHLVCLRYNGKTIGRPYVGSCIDACKKGFNIDI